MGDKHDVCEKYLAQGCKWLAGGCPCKMFTDHSNFLEYTRTHWKSVIFCKECNHLIDKDGCFYCDCHKSADGSLLVVEDPDIGWCNRGEN